MLESMTQASEGTIRYFVVVDNEVIVAVTNVPELSWRFVSL